VAELITYDDVDPVCQRQVEEIALDEVRLVPKSRDRNRRARLLD
jgi:hypothetical protein